MVSLHSPPSRLSFEDLPALSPLEVKSFESEVELLGLSKLRADALLTLSFDGQTQGFFAEYTGSWSAQTFQTVLEQLERRLTSFRDALPLLILPYLDEEKLHQLAERGISGLDLCGNTDVRAPSRWAVRLSGRPNRFRVEKPLKNPYGGKSALVGRTLLRQAHFENADALLKAIRSRGGNLSQLLVSRVLKALGEDLVVKPDAGWAVQLLHPKRLLERLASGWPSDQGTLLWRGKVQRSTSTLLPELFARAAQSGVRAAVTGLGSAARHTGLSLENLIVLYAEAAPPLLVGLDARPGRAFANIEIYKPPEDSVFFDLERDSTGVSWASPVQTYLELQHGDARALAAAQGLKQALLEAVHVP